jgi:RNA polymerase sigma-70 factor (ECF subfamily)
MDSPQTREEWAALVRRVYAGDKKAVERLADLLGVRAYWFHRRRGLSREDAEDLAQDCVWHIFRHLNQFDGANFTAWAYTILRRKLADHFRRHRIPCVPLEDGDLNEPVPEAANDGLLDQAAQSALEEALAALTADERKVLELRHGREAVPYEDLARELGVSPGAARARYVRAREKLKARLRKETRMQAWLARRHS